MADMNELDREMYLFEREERLQREKEKKRAMKTARQHEKVGYNKHLVLPLALQVEGSINHRCLSFAALCCWLFLQCVKASLQNIFPALHTVTTLPSHACPAG